ncbi:transcriptional regulator BetI [Novosphingobium resinovorum]|uniref:Transcriptional regulator BetI n=1 Tax=Novosphingobium resinovorum TaxID=158500 RepID=A0A031JQV5_9SPHN|nr:TetR/AcrR family transcriptional regulator [Novosphingobium resinovorum]EZP79300.1 transcriptional regulator BetI [Novosphingobium resinovorum]
MAMGNVGAGPEGGNLLKQVLVEKTIEHIASHGISNLTMRAVSAEAGGTTAAIVHHYGSKAGLIAEAASVALQQEQAWHARLLEQIQGHRLDHLNFVEWMAQYLSKRTNRTYSRFWSEVLFHTNIVADGRSIVANWHCLRADFWADVLRIQGIDPYFAQYIATYMCMEETWSYSLGEFAEYPILVRETLRALTAGMFGRTWDEAISVSVWLEERLDRFPLMPPQAPETMEERLLAMAAQDILNSGIKLNQRRIAEMAGASPSMIAYHFESMSAFRNQAVWRAMLRPFDDPQNPYSQSRAAHTIEEWATLMADIIMPVRGKKRSGSYSSFARAIGEIALLSGRQPEMKTLAEHLRILDGTASFQAGNTIWKDVVQLKRGQSSAFAVWLKGQAVLSSALGYDMKENWDALVGAVTRLIPAQGAIAR